MTIQEYIVFTDDVEQLPDGERVCKAVQLWWDSLPTAETGGYYFSVSGCVNIVKDYVILCSRQKVETFR